jgi:predicted RNase H-like HicB family nuclease
LRGISSARIVNSVEATFTASVYKDGALYVAQCLEINVASQGETEAEALANLREALELWFEGEAEAPAAIFVHAAA